MASIHAGGTRLCRHDAQITRRSAAGGRHLESDHAAADRCRFGLNGHGRCELARADGADDGRHLGARNARAQLAGGCRRRDVDRRQGHDGCRQDDGADGDRSVVESGAHSDVRAPTSTRAAGRTSNTRRDLAIASRRSTTASSSPGTGVPGHPALGTGRHASFAVHCCCARCLISPPSAACSALRFAAGLAAFVAFAAFRLLRCLRYLSGRAHPADSVRPFDLAAPAR